MFKLYFKAITVCTTTTHGRYCNALQGKNHSSWYTDFYYGILWFNGLSVVNTYGAEGEAIKAYSM